MDLDADAATSQTDIVLSNVCERLMQLGSDLAVTPHLASDFEWKSDSELVFTLRDDVTFHDGSPMTADDVVWSMQRHMADGASEADEFVNVTGVSKTAENEVTFAMAQPDAIFVKALAGDAGVVLNPRAVAAQGDDYGTTAGSDACSGPFVLDEWRSGSQVTLKKAPDYWDADRAALTEELIFRWGSDDVIINSLLTGDADGTYLENLASATRLVGDEDIKVAQGEDTRVWSLMATERGGLTDPRLRQALSLAIDREGLNQAAFSGLGRPWNEPVGSGAWGYERDAFEAANAALEFSPITRDEAHLDKARELVAEVGPTEEIVVASDGDSIRSALAEAVVAAADEIGLEASIIRIPTAQYGDYYSDASVRQKADLFSDDYFVSKFDPVGFYKNGASDSSVQWLLDDPEFDQLVQDARAAVDDTERSELAIDLAARWGTAMPWISTTASPNTVAYSAEVTGIPAAGNFRYYPWAAGLGAAEE
ncbi:ABC transporter substrate-binding protein [Microbacterium sp. NPDC058345]|uniref:ABC transporter substrate-binding protein n=1 Tax=Microbacterium sp. NPDC058345 TaxID=3346455 RepID=UPI00366280B5